MSVILKPYKPRERYVPKNTKHEQSLQLQVCRYLDLQYPHVIYRSDYASGLKLSMAQAQLHRRMQSCRAFPDLQLLEPRFVNGVQYAGLLIELKREGVRTTLKNGNLPADLHIREQAAVLKRLNDKGYLARFASGFDQAQKLIDWYMGKPINLELF